MDNVNMMNSNTSNSNIPLKSASASSNNGATAEIDHLYNWLATLELSEYYSLFKKHSITFELLPALDKSALKQMGIYKVGDLIKLLNNVKVLKFKNIANSIQLNELINIIDQKVKSQQPPLPPPSTTGTESALSSATEAGVSSASTFVNSNEYNPASYNLPSGSSSKLDIIENNNNSSTNQHSNITFILQDGTTKKINVEGCFNADSIKRKILKKLQVPITKDVSSNYNTYIIDKNNELHQMFDIELVTVCHQTDDPKLEKVRIIICPNNEKPSAKAIETSQKIMKKHESIQKKQSQAQQQHKENHSQLRSFFGQRPPSELISNNLAEYFPNTRLDTLQETVRNSVRMSKLINSPRFSMLSSNERPMSIISTATTRPLTTTITADAVAANNNDRASVFSAGTIQSSSASSRISKIELIDEEDFSIDEESVLSQLSLEEETGPKNWLKGAKIGAGSFGTVYLGMNALTGELMAVKQVKMAQNSEVLQKHHQMMVDALRQEMALLKNLHHDNIVSYIGSNNDSEFLNIFLEYVPGGSVTTMLNNYGPFEEPLIRNFIRQILNGLNYLHGEHIIHRDIKGANVLIDIKGCAKISDFGISKKLDSDKNQQNVANKRSSLQGSVYWMAPEVVKQTAYTAKADIWSMGCLVVEMFTGKHPFPDFSQMQAIFKIGTHTRPTIPAWATQEAKSFMMQTFELDYEKRPNAEQLLTHDFLNSLILKAGH